jgi:rhodanese-related sulfurtransferase
MRLARNIAARGYGKVLVYEGGFNEWMAEDGSKATGSEPGTPEGG